MNSYFFYFCRVIGEVGLKHTQILPEIVPVLISVLNDPMPAVARQAISCGLNLFSSTLEKIAIQVSRFCVHNLKTFLHFTSYGCMLMTSLLPYIANAFIWN